MKCGSSPGENICVKNYLDVMSAYNIELDKKEIAKINKVVRKQANNLFLKDIILIKKKKLTATIETLLFNTPAGSKWK